MKIKICIEDNCQNAQTTKNYCRLHYLKNWKEIKETSKRKAADRLNKYVEGICKKHPDRYVDAIRKDIKDDSAGDPKGADEMISGDLPDDVMETFGYQDEASLDKIMSRIKVDKDY